MTDDERGPGDYPLRDAETTDAPGATEVKGAHAMTDEGDPNKREPTEHEQKLYRVQKWGLIVLTFYAGFTLYAAWKTGVAADAAREGVEVTRRNVEISQRAWVIANRMANMDLAEGASAIVELKNVGRTPATYVFTHGQMTAMERPFPDDPPYTALSRPSGIATIGPEQVINLPVPFDGPLPGDVDNIRAGRHSLFFYGYVFYWDEFGAKRGLTFCGRYNPASKGFDFCPTYNQPW